MTQFCHGTRSTLICTATPRYSPFNQPAETKENRKNKMCRTLPILNCTTGDEYIPSTVSSFRSYCKKNKKKTRSWWAETLKDGEQKWFKIPFHEFKQRKRRLFSLSLIIGLHWSLSTGLLLYLYFPLHKEEKTRMKEEKQIHWGAEGKCDALALYLSGTCANSITVFISLHSYCSAQKPGPGGLLTEPHSPISSWISSATYGTL